jgi:hypothetical protein
MYVETNVESMLNLDLDIMCLLGLQVFVCSLIHSDSYGMASWVWIFQGHATWYILITGINLLFFKVKGYGCGIAM